MTLNNVLYELVDVLLPISICVILPILIVWINNKRSKHETDRQSEIMLKAIEKGVEINPEFFNSKRVDAMSVKERLLRKFTGGVITGLTGVILTIAFAIIHINAVNNSIVSLTTIGMIISSTLIAVGAALLISYYVGGKTLAKEIEAEERAKTRE